MIRNGLDSLVSTAHAPPLTLLRLNQVLVVEQRPHVLLPKPVKRRLRLVAQRAPHVDLSLTPVPRAYRSLVIVHGEIQRTVGTEHAVEVLLRLTPRSHRYTHALHYPIVVLAVRVAEGDGGVVRDRGMLLRRVDVADEAVDPVRDAPEQHAVQRRVHEHGVPVRRAPRLRQRLLASGVWHGRFT